MEDIKKRTKTKPNFKKKNRVGGVILTDYMTS